jgi:squalene-associated FAD-dependent desaturase
MRVAVIGAGWAGMACAVELSQAGHTATVFEASRAVGGRARALISTLPNGDQVTLDNGQHILIGAYTDTLRLIQRVGVDPQTALLRLPLTLKFPDNLGLQLPRWPTPLDAFAGILAARGWRMGDKWSLLRAAIGWQLAGFRCQPQCSVAELCERVSPRVMTELIEPLCVSALNTPADEASGQVFLRVLRDALFGLQGGSHLLLPRVDLSALFPHAAARWLTSRGSEVRLGERVDMLRPEGTQWRVQGELFDAVMLATSPSESIRALDKSAQYATESIANPMQQWARRAELLRFEAIATVYAWASGAALPHPMLTLRSSPTAPAQFVFDRGQLGGPAGLLAFVVSASTGEREALQAQVLVQAKEQLGLELEAVQTVVEKRATFACTPGLQRPGMHLAPGLLACGDYVKGPYPATLEGAVRSAIAAAAALTSAQA